MLDEFDEVDPFASRRLERPGQLRSIARQRIAISRLVARLYRGSSLPVRAQMLSSLLRPLGLLSLAGVASGAFRRLLHRDDQLNGSVSAADVVQFTADQVSELTYFVHEVDPDALQQLLAQLTQNPLGMTALSAALLVLLHRRLQGAPPGGRSARPGASPSHIDGAGGPPHRG